MVNRDNQFTTFAVIALAIILLVFAAKLLLVLAVLGLLYLAINKSSTP